MDELHIMEGIVNYISSKGLVIKIGRENAMKWPKKNKCCLSALPG